MPKVPTGLQFGSKAEKSSTSQKGSRACSGVFQYDLDDHKMERLRAVIHDHVHRCIKFRKPTKEFPGWLLYYGKYTQYHTLEKCLRELIWKRSELTGKYIGCPYWSVEAKAFFENELNRLRRSYGDDVSLREACKLAECFSSKKLGGRRLEHEHVFPISPLLQRLLDLRSSVSLEVVKKEMERLSVGCVVLRSEHPSHHSGDAENPWLRYAKAGIVLVDNRGWPPNHRKMIEKASVRIQT